MATEKNPANQKIKLNKVVRITSKALSPAVIFRSEHAQTRCSQFRSLGVSDFVSAAPHNDNDNRFSMTPGDSATALCRPENDQASAFQLIHQINVYPYSNERP
jgi:hypothetical protein